METSRSIRLLNAAADILIVTTITLLVGVLAYRTILQTPLDSLEAELLKSGDYFKALPEVDFHNSPHTLVLALDTKCPFCAQGIPFYKKLIAKSKESSAVRVIAVFSNKSEEVNSFVEQHQLGVESVPNIDLAKLGVDITPTVIWVNSNRRILGSYEGMLQTKQESAFLELFDKRLFRR